MKKRPGATIQVQNAAGEWIDAPVTPRLPTRPIVTSPPLPPGVTLHRSPFGVVVSARTKDERTIRVAGYFRDEVVSAMKAWLDWEKRGQ
jgi:hypothetical protein